MALYAIKDLSDERIAFLYGARDHRFNQKLRVLSSFFVFACEEVFKRLREFLWTAARIAALPGFPCVSPERLRQRSLWFVP